jgi:hypothetical protein
MSRTVPLLPKSNVADNRETRGEWHLFEQPQPYIRGIDTGELAEGLTSEVLSAIVTGVPTPWARAKMFAFAFEYLSDRKDTDASGLLEFYRSLINEWKGLMAALAIFPERFRISDPISLEDNLRESIGEKGKKFDKRQLYHLPSAFGRMLFEDKDVWSDPESVQKNARGKAPFIQLIYYNEKLVGSTSPYTLLMTANDYSELEGVKDLNWYRNGRFDDPVRYGDLTNDELQKLYLLVGNIAEKEFRFFEKAINETRTRQPQLSYRGFKATLQAWLKEIQVIGKDLIESGTLDGTLEFVAPFKRLFNVRQLLYVNIRGGFSFQQAGDIPGENPIELLHQGFYLLEFPQSLDPEQPLEQASLHYLTAEIPGTQEKVFFALPLSRRGLEVFRNQMPKVLNGRSAQNPGEEPLHSLRAVIADDPRKVRVELRIVVDGRPMTAIVREYLRTRTEDNRSLIVWPNFISDRWTHYYTYSEFPEHSGNTHFVPFFREAGSDDYAFMVNSQKKILFADDLGENSKIQIDKIVEFPNAPIEGDKHRYDIFRCNFPTAGWEVRQQLRGRQERCGFLLMKNVEDDTTKHRLRDLSKERLTQKVAVGVDFGSNNSCFSYSRIDSNEPKPIKFKNRRRFVIGLETNDPQQKTPAKPDELLFFQNVESDNGQIKSWLLEHFPTFVSSGSDELELAGGVPIFKTAIHLRAVNPNSILTNCGTLYHGMKWLSGQEDIKKKVAYLSTVWLMACAELYELGQNPAELRWSHPGSFSAGEVTSYKGIMQRVNLVKPIVGSNTKLQEPSTEAEAVSNYSISTGKSLSEKNIFLGIDVGGSTSDFLLLVQDPSLRGTTNPYRLLRQSSLRMAAGYLTAAIEEPGAMSERFRQALRSFHSNKNSRFFIPEFENNLKILPQSASYYLNVFFDRFTREQMTMFYSHLINEAREIFVIPMYVCGFLTYYGGMLTAWAKREHAFLGQVEFVDFMPFGKGGRLFDWVDRILGPTKSEQYLSECFEAGYGENPIQFRRETSLREDDKSEVSKGLSAQQVVSFDPKIRQISDIFGEEGFVLEDVILPGNAGDIASRFEKIALESEIPFDSIITYDHFGKHYNYLRYPAEFRMFQRFLDVFLKYAGPQNSNVVSQPHKLALDVSVLNTHLKGYIERDPEFTKSKNRQDFKFKHPMIVLEAMCYLDLVLLKQLT